MVGSDWTEISLDYDLLTFTLQDLPCGSTFLVNLVAHNIAGTLYSVLEVDLPPILQVDSKSVLNIDFPPILQVDFPTVLQVDFSSIFQVDFPLILQVDFSPILKVEFTSNYR